MLKLMKYLKPYVLSVVIIFALLFAQAQADLALPDYMSRIVNVGLQRGGIADAVPEAMRVSTFDRLLLLLSAEDKTFVSSHFETVAKAGSGVTTPSGLTDRYPALKSEPIVRLLTVSADERVQLDSVLGRAETLARFIEAAASGQALPGVADSSGGGDAGSTLFGQLPPGTDLYGVLAKMPEPQRQTLLTQANARLDALSATVTGQVAALWVQGEYTALGMATTGVQNNYILSIGGIMLLIALAGAVCTVLVSLLSSRVAAGLGRDLRSQVFRKVESFSNAEFDNFSTASLITRSTNDIQQIQMTLVILLRMIFYAPMMAIGGFFKVVRSDVSMTWIIGLAIAALMTLILVLFIFALPRFKLVQKLIDRLNLVTREMLTGLMVIRAFNNERHQEERFDQSNRDLTRVNLFVNRLMVLMMPFMMLIMNVTTLAVVWFGARQVDIGAMQVGSLFAFMQYSIQIIFSFLFISFVFILLPRASVSAQRIDEVLRIQPAIVDPAQPKNFPADGSGEVVFDHVGFRYPGADANVLCDITFTARPGETTAFIGSTGSGKSTLVNLIPRFYDVTEGSIRIDGTDIRDVTLESLRHRIGYVPQKGVLFTGDIAENIRYGEPDADDEAVRQAAVTAQALDFIEHSPEGFATEIAQGGSNVSGGQKQRLSIARALARRPSIYIFDDSFSALDYRTDARLRQALKLYTSDATVLIVAQRIGTIIKADRIVVLEEGAIVGIGTHRELMQSCPVYQEIALSQLSKEELAV